MRPKIAWTISLLVLIAAGALAFIFGLHWHWLVAWLVAANLVSFLAFMGDKWQARHTPDPARRIPERALLSCCFLGGTVGGLMAMLWTRHKTRDRRFKVGLGLILIIQVLAIAVLIWRDVAAG